MSTYSPVLINRGGQNKRGVLLKIGDYIGQNQRNVLRKGFKKGKTLVAGEGGGAIIKHSRVRF